MSDWHPGLRWGSVHQQRGDGDKKPRVDQGAGGAGKLGRQLLNLSETL